MPQYEIPVTAVASVRRVFSIEAKNEAQAIKQLKRELKDDGTNGWNWGLNGLLQCSGRADLAKFYAPEIMEDEIESDTEDGDAE